MRRFYHDGAHFGRFRRTIVNVRRIARISVCGLFYYDGAQARRIRTMQLAKYITGGYNRLHISLFGVFTTMWGMQCPRFHRRLLNAQATRAYSPDASLLLNTTDGRVYLVGSSNLFYRSPRNSPARANWKNRYGWESPLPRLVYAGGVGVFSDVAGALFRPSIPSIQELPSIGGCEFGILTD